MNFSGVLLPALNSLRGVLRTGTVGEQDGGKGSALELGNGLEGGVEQPGIVACGRLGYGIPYAVDIGSFVGFDRLLEQKAGRFE